MQIKPITTVDEVLRTQALIRKTWESTYPNTNIPLTLEDIRAYFSARPAPDEEKIIIWLEKQKNDPNSLNLIAIPDTDNQILGTISGVRDEAGEVELEVLYVDPSSQRQGVGRMLVEKLLAWAGDVRIRLWVVEYNTAAQAFYTRMGFHKTENTKTNSTFTFPISGYSFREIEMVRPPSN